MASRLMWLVQRKREGKDGTNKQINELNKLEIYITNQNVILPEWLNGKIFIFWGGFSVFSKFSTMNIYDFYKEKRRV